jgi:hypothetical protein
MKEKRSASTVVSPNHYASRIEILNRNIAALKE